MNTTTQRRLTVTVHETFGHYTVETLKWKGERKGELIVWNDQTNQRAYSPLSMTDAVRVARWLAGEGTL